MAAPLPDTALELLARSDAELVAAASAATPEEAFRHAHLAAMRAGAAVLAVRGRPGPRTRARTVWDMVARVAPELAPFTAYFAGNAAARAAVEAGRAGAVDAARARRATAAAEDFHAAVRALVAEPQGGLALRAS
jgi:hypothetical protein